MLTITGLQSGQYRTVQYEARQLDEGWEIIIRCAGSRIDETTLALSPWPVIEKLIAEILDTSRKQGVGFSTDKPKQAPKPANERKRPKKPPPESVPDSIGVNITEAPNAEEQASG